MTNPKDDERFNETLKRMLKAPPKPHDQMKKGQRPKPPPKEKRDQ